jgi:hypothetical protein
LSQQRFTDQCNDFVTHMVLNARQRGFFIQKSSRVGSSELKRSLRGEVLNLSSMVIICLNNRSFSLSFESCARYKKTALTPVVRVQWYIFHRRNWTFLPNDVGITPVKIPPTYVGSPIRRCATASPPTKSQLQYAPSTLIVET